MALTYRCCQRGSRLIIRTEVYFPCTKVLLSALSVGRVVRREKIDVVVLFVDMRHLYLFPTYLITKVILGRKLVWWGQGRDLANRDATIKNLAYATEHALCDAVILYAETSGSTYPQDITRKFYREQHTSSDLPGSS